MGDFLSFLYTVVDSLSLILFLDVFAERRWSDRKFAIGVGCFVALNFWILKVPLIFFHRNQAIKIGMILLSYTAFASCRCRVSYHLFPVFRAGHAGCFCLWDGR